MKKYQNENTKTGKHVTNKGFHFKFADEKDEALQTNTES